MSKTTSFSTHRNEFNRHISLVSEDNVEVDPNSTTDELIFDTTTSSNFNNDSKINKYTIRYRLIKTGLLIFTWIVYSMNFEMIGPTFEDLRCFLNVDYSRMSFIMVLRNIGFFSLTLIFGSFYDRISSFSETYVGIVSLFIGLTNFLIPITNSYSKSMVFYLIQGICQSIYELGGNYMILNLWFDISNSPINTMHSGYGIGAILAIQIAKPFIIFDSQKANILDFNQTSLAKLDFTKPLQTCPLNNTLNNGMKEINLAVPYWIVASFSILLSILFFIAQFFEHRANKRYETNKKIILLQDFDLNSINSEAFNESIQIPQSSEPREIYSMSKTKKIIQRLFFSENVYLGKILFYMVIQIILHIVLFMLISGLNTILSRYMLTYLILGPAKFSLDQFVAVQTLYWSFFIFGRLIATYLAYKIDIIKFFIFLLFLNMLTNSLFLIPYFCSYKLFFWIEVSLIGLTSGPLMPSGLMVAKQILNFNSFLLSLFIVGLSLGGLISMQLTGIFLDYFKPPVDSKSWLGFNNSSFQTNSSYLIPYLAFFCSFFALLIFLPIAFGYKKIHSRFK